LVKFITAAFGGFQVDGISLQVTGALGFPLLCVHLAVRTLVDSCVKDLFEFLAISIGFGNFLTTTPTDHDYVRMYVCMHACMNACMHVFMYERTNERRKE
jgi:hypothetical protein